MLHIGIVAGESSGDQLGAALIAALQQRHSELKITGMAGPKMTAAGCQAIASIDELSVMGLVEVVRKYPRLRRLRNRICDYYLEARPDVFIGIDVPDFVMGIEARIHAEQIKTVHCVAPQTWAWRQSRALKIADRLDLLLALFPFEEAFFNHYGVNTRFVGHPVADQIPLQRDVTGARVRLGLEQGKRYVALMPGSRRQELVRHVDLFLQAANLIAEKLRGVAFIGGAISSEAREIMERRSRVVSPNIEFVIRQDHSHDVLGASDAALVASGTVTMEGMFAKTPMVVAYKLSSLTYQAMKRMVKVPYIAMPNILAGSELVPEFVQGDAKPEALAQAVIRWLDDEAKTRGYQTQCVEIHQALRQDAAATAAREVLQLIGSEAARIDRRSS
jgi:lipid-A-disaccharide synthase